MIGYVDKLDEMRAEFDLTLNTCDLSELSSKSVVEEARRIEELLAKEN